MAKPGKICRLKKGKAFGAFDGLADTWNWMVDFVQNLEGDGVSVSVDRTNDSFPVIKGIGGNGGSGEQTDAQELMPFSCRKNALGLWEIYLPSGCVSVGMTHKPLNSPAASGGDWYALPVFSGGGTATGGTYHVTVHAKYYAAVEGVDGFGSAGEFGTHYFFVDAAYEGCSADDNYTGDWGDTFSAVVGYIEGNAAVNTQKQPLRVFDSGDRYFNIVHSFSVGSGSVIASDKLYLANIVFNAAGVSFTGNRVFDLGVQLVGGNNSTISVYLKLDTLKSPAEGTVVVNASAPDGVGENEEITEDQFIQQNKSLTDIMVLLYRLKGGRVILDNRNALNNIQVYM